MTGKVPSRVGAERAAHLLHLIASPTRLLIIQLVSGRGAHVQQIAHELAMTQSAVSHQLRLLTNERITVFKRKGRTVTYSLAKTPAARDIRRLLRTIL